MLSCAQGSWCGVASHSHTSSTGKWGGGCVWEPLLDPEMESSCLNKSGMTVKIFTCICSLFPSWFHQGLPEDWAQPWLLPVTPSRRDTGMFCSRRRSRMCLCVLCQGAASQHGCAAAGGIICDRRNAPENVENEQFLHFSCHLRTGQENVLQWFSWF